MTVSGDPAFDLALVVIDTNGKRHIVPAAAGWRVMEIIRDNNLPIRAECGGSCACATCHVYVAPEWAARISGPQSEEIHMLDQASGFDPQYSRLSCQILMREDLDGMVVTLAPGSEP